MCVSEITASPERLRALLCGASFETTARPSAIDEVMAAGLPTGTSVYVTALPRDAPAALRDACRKLRARNLNPVPHLGARYFTTARDFEDLLLALREEAEVDQVLVIGGDIDMPRGPFSSAVELLRSGSLVRAGIRRVGIAAYPEGHAKIPRQTLEEAIAAKIGDVRDMGMEPYVVSQFCFGAEPIAAWLSQITRRFTGLPVHVGIAGPAAVSTLVRYGLSCGIGPSLRALRRTSVLKLTQITPADLLSSLASRPSALEKIAGLHFFTFGGITRTAEWVRSYSPT